MGEDMNIIEVEADQLHEGIRPAFGSPGGKRFLAKTIVGFIPDHKRYVEAFAGGAAVFFAKRRSEEEVLNDKDAEIAAAYKFLRDSTDADIAALRERKQTFDKLHFEKLRDSAPGEGVNRFYRFIYTLSFSFGRDRKTPNHTAAKTIASRLDRMPRLRERLKGVQVFNESYEVLLKKFDAPDTFFYLEQEGKLSGFDVKPEDMKKLLAGLKGKFLLSQSDTPRARAIAECLREAFNIQKVMVRRMLNANERKMESEIVIANFPLVKRTTYLESAMACSEPPDEALDHLYQDGEAKWQEQEQARSAIQTVIFSKARWNMERARKWLSDHDFTQAKVDETEGTLRFRQFPSGQCIAGSFAALTRDVPVGITLLSCKQRVSAGLARAVAPLSDGTCPPTYPVKAKDPETGEMMCFVSKPEQQESAKVTSHPHQWAERASRFVTASYCEGWAKLDDEEREARWVAGLSDYAMNVEALEGDMTQAAAWFASRGFRFGAMAVRKGIDP